MSTPPADQDMIDPDPNCPQCHGTGTDGDCSYDGRIMDIDCGCRFRHLAPTWVVGDRARAAIERAKGDEQK